jgi:hypothetical protein
MPIKSSDQNLTPRPRPVSALAQVAEGVVAALFVGVVARSTGVLDSRPKARPWAKGKGRTRANGDGTNGRWCVIGGVNAPATP